MKNEFYLCSALVVEAFPDVKKSNPFKSGYNSDDENYFVIEIPEGKFKELESYFNKKQAELNPWEPFDFWLNECCDSLVSLEKSDLFEDEDDEPNTEQDNELNIEDCRAFGLFAAIEQYLNISKERNKAYAIYKLADKYGITPIEFINRLTV